ncbi:hypothetical protein NKG94_27655 [Micromonospora sp. M12]
MAGGHRQRPAHRGLPGALGRRAGGPGELQLLPDLRHGRDRRRGAAGRTGRGYAFYHRQDAENAVDGSGLYVAYGLFGQPPTADIGEEVAAALRAEG